MLLGSTAAEVLLGSTAAGVLLGSNVLLSMHLSHDLLCIRGSQLEYKKKIENKIIGKVPISIYQIWRTSDADQTMKEIQAQRDHECRQESLHTIFCVCPVSVNSQFNFTCKFRKFFVVIYQFLLYCLMYFQCLASNMTLKNVTEKILNCLIVEEDQKVDFQV